MSCRSASHVRLVCPPCSLVARSILRSGSARSFVFPSLQSTLVEGAVWHVLSAKFWNAWCEYTGFVPDLGKVGPGAAAAKGPRPDPIDNSALLDPAYPASEGVIRKDAMENEQYALVEERVAALLYEWYPGAGPQLAREVVTVGVRKRTRVDVHPLRFRLLPCDPDTGAAPASSSGVSVRSQSMTSKATFSDLQEKLHNEATKAREQAAAAFAPVSDGSAMEVSFLFHSLSLFLPSDGLEAEWRRASPSFSAILPS